MLARVVSAQCASLVPAVRATRGLARCVGGFSLWLVENRGSIGEGSESGGIDVDLLSASLRASTSDLETFVAVLADKLEGALPGRVQVARKSVGWFSKDKRVERVQCELGGQRYVLTAAGGVVEARRATAVRGVVLKTEALPLEEWLDALALDLANEARTNERAQIALQRLLAE
jgi:hypothetical protein